MAYKYQVDLTVTEGDRKFVFGGDSVDDLIAELGRFERMENKEVKEEVCGDCQF